MKKAFDISKYAATLDRSAAAGAARDIETITTEIVRLKQDAGSAILGIGERLIEAKEMLPHGAWLPWLEERVEFSERTARNFMRLAREWTNRQALADLGAAKALTLLALPPGEREAFMAENDVVDMTSRELEKAIRERDAARREAESARADARTAEEGRAKMGSDLKALAEIHRAAQEGEARAREALAKAEAELKELRDRPVEVAVEVDREAVEKARAEAAAGMQAKVDAAEKQREEAERALAGLKGQAADRAAILSRAEKAEAELAEVRRQLDAAVKSGAPSAIGPDGDLASFRRLLNRSMTLLEQMLGLRMKIQGRDAESGEECRRALLAYFEEGRRRVG